VRRRVLEAAGLSWRNGIRMFVRCEQELSPRIAWFCEWATVLARKLADTPTTLRESVAHEPEGEEMFSRWMTAAGLASVLATAAMPAFAQALYRCSSGSATYVSDRPCTGAGNPGRAQLRAMGAVQQPNQYASPSYSPQMAKAGEHLQYMSVECANLAEGVRTGPARGLRGAALSELSENYRKQCAEDEQQARQRMWQQQTDERTQRKQQDQARSDDRKRAVIASEQCNEMLGALHARRKRAATMTAGERADLDLFEANYKARCTSG